VVGGVVGGWKGAAIGAAAGAVAGGAVGNLLDRQAAELKAQRADAVRTADGILVKLKEDLLFTTGSDVLKPEAVEQVAALGDILAKYPDDRIEVRGYTDSTGPARFNEDLSYRRAEAVRKVLVSRGVSDKQALSVGMGEKEPVASNASATGRAKNRRVELRIAMAK
jgi:outer membrane protein OmpA-like peptidoglycan-associated protein